MNRQALVDSYAAAFKLGYQISKTEFGLVFDKDEMLYDFKDDRKVLHLVETVLLGHECPTGNWIQDVASSLGTTQEFLRGFLAGLAFAIGPEDTPS